MLIPRADCLLKLYLAAEMMETAKPVEPCPKNNYALIEKLYDISITHFAYLRFCIVGFSLSVLF